ncbi:hypothetical protein BKI51_11545 [Alphaproteobacteria bacterium AO1-B]|nr:hypothetical protein BKI51_11545 [Alphaproteobacteria bacterium AO1-B]
MGIVRAIVRYKNNTTCLSRLKVFAKICLTQIVWENEIFQIGIIRIGRKFCLNLKKKLGCDRKMLIRSQMAL